MFSATGNRVTEHSHPPKANLYSELGSDAELQTPPEEILELSVAAMRFVQAALGIEPDESSETLPLVDHYLSQSLSSLEERPELEPLITRSVGAYFGELLRRVMNGFWLMPSEDVFDWRVCSRDVFLSVNPVGMVYDALHGGGEHSGPSAELYLDRPDAALIEARLSALPPVREEEFSLLSTRYDVVEIVMAALREASLGDGEPDPEAGPTYTLEDYQDSLDRN